MTVFLCCTVDCGAPAIPFGSCVLGDVSSTTENAIVTFQCGKGLIPSHPINITCTRNGQWRPDPAGVQCVAEGKELKHILPLTSTSSNTLNIIQASYVNSLRRQVCISPTVLQVPHRLCLEVSIITWV